MAAESPVLERKFQGKSRSFNWGKTAIIALWHFGGSLSLAIPAAASGSIALYRAEMEDHRFTETQANAIKADPFGYSRPTDTPRVGIRETAGEVRLEVARLIERAENALTDNRVDPSCLRNKPDRVRPNTLPSPSVGVKYKDVDEAIIATLKDGVPTQTELDFIKSLGGGREIAALRTTANISHTSNPNLRSLSLRAQKSETPEEKRAALMAIAKNLGIDGVDDYKWNEEALVPVKRPFVNFSSPGIRGTRITEEGRIDLFLNDLGDVGFSYQPKPKLTDPINRAINDAINVPQEYYARWFKRI